MKIRQYTYYDRNFNIIRYLELDEDGSFILLRHFDKEGNPIYTLRNDIWVRTYKYNMTIYYDDEKATLIEEEVNSDGYWWATVKQNGAISYTTLRSVEFKKVFDEMGTLTYLRK